jgi:RNA polymerase sigma factor (sigma-70 family)
MNHQVPVSVRNGVTNLQEQLQFGAEIEPAGICVDWRSIDILHDRIGRPHRVEVPIDKLQLFDSNWSAEDVLALNEALEALAAEDARAAKALEGYFFGGLTIEEVADWLEVAPRTIKRDLSYAKAWIRQRLTAK